MKKMLLLCGAMLLVSASMAAAAGLNLNWDACIGDGVTQIRQNPCNSNLNSGAHANNVVMSVVLAQDMPLYQATVGLVNVSTDGPLPAWWGNACAAKPATNVFSILGGNICGGESAYGGVTPGGGISAVNTLWNGSNTTQVQYALAVPAGSETNLIAGTEYFLGELQITNANSTGTVCAGCSTPACLNFGYAKMDRLVGSASVTTTITSGDQQPFIYWQGATASCLGATPTHNTTWGSIKALYR